MTAADVIADLEARGVRLQATGQGLDYEAPEGALRPSDLEALRAHKAAILALLRERPERAAEDVSRTSLWSLDRIVELAVPWWPETLFIVPGPVHARKLKAEGVSPGRIWDVAEPLDLLLVGVTPDDARSVAEERLRTAGTIVTARKLSTAKRS